MGNRIDLKPIHFSRPEPEKQMMKTNNMRLEPYIQDIWQREYKEA
jgi:hypothetical protein